MTENPLESLDLKILEEAFSHDKHFTKKTYEEAVGKMNHGDGRNGEHWTLDEVNEIAKRHDLGYDGYNEYDFAYVLNMVYMDYKGAIPDDDESYFKVAKAFIEDKDAPEGKAYIYWKAMNY